MVVRGGSRISKTGATTTREHEMKEIVPWGRGIPGDRLGSANQPMVVYEKIF